MPTKVRFLNIQSTVVVTPKTGFVYIFTVFLMLQQCLSASVMEGVVEVVSDRVERAR